jgi:nucleoside-diphosphate-sugar epimerase
MRVFLTGATGYVGSAVFDALVRGGHDVTALVRNNEKAARIASRGGHPVIGQLADPESYRRKAEGLDAYIHTALDAASGRAPVIDSLTIDTLLAEALRPRTAALHAPATRAFIYTSGIWVLGRTFEPATEDAPVNPIAHVTWRAVQEQRVLAAQTSGLRTIVVRPGAVYGGGTGLVGDLFRAANQGLVRIVGDGNNRWPLVYDRDLGDLYARLVARPDAAGIYHANDEGDERVNDIVAAIVPHLALRPEVRHVPLEEARAKMGSYAEALSLDQIVRSPRARALGWAPSLHSVSGNAARLLDEWRASRNGQQPEPYPSRHLT